MTDFKNCLSSEYDDLPFPPFRECVEGMQDDQDNCGQLSSTEIETIKLVSLPLYSPLDMIIPPSKMLEEDVYQTLIMSACQASSSSPSNIPQNINNKLIDSCEDIDSTIISKTQTDLDSKSADHLQETTFPFLKQNSNHKGKNQYDKNIVGNICSTIIRKMLSSSSLKEVKFYCEHYNVSTKDFLEYFRSFLRKNVRFGTSELYTFFLKHDKEAYKNVFGLFMTRFINEEYLLYILTAGKMCNEYKYLECATNLLYIPRLPQEQYDLISRFHEVSRDI